MVEPAVMQTVGADAVVLESDCWGDVHDQPLVLLHGGGQTRHAWAAAAAQLAGRGLYVVTPDLRGHGRSGWAADGDYYLEAHANDLRALCARLSRPPIVVGASLGGLTALVAGGEAPQLPCAAVVMVDIAHRSQPAGISRIVGFMRGHPDGFANLDEAAAAVAAYLPQRAQRPGTRGLEHNLRRRSDGRWIWHWDPRLLDALVGPKRPQSPPTRFLAAANQLPGPLCLVRGATSDVIDEDIVAEFLAAVPGATTAVVAGAGHMVAGDRNDRFVQAIIPLVSTAAAAGQALAESRALWAGERGAVPHGEGTLLAYLDRVALRVAAWGEPVALQRAVYAEQTAAAAEHELRAVTAARDLDAYLTPGIGAERSAIASRLRSAAASLKPAATACINALVG